MKIVFFLTVYIIPDPYFPSKKNIKILSYLSTLNRQHYLLVNPLLIPDMLQTAVSLIDRHNQ